MAPLEVRLIAQKGEHVLAVAAAAVVAVRGQHRFRTQRYVPPEHRHFSARRSSIASGSVRAHLDARFASAGHKANPGLTHMRLKGLADLHHRVGSVQQGSSDVVAKRRLQMCMYLQKRAQSGMSMSARYSLGSGSRSGELAIIRLEQAPRPRCAAEPSK
jgi:hypothetical protein